MILVSQALAPCVAQAISVPRAARSRRARRSAAAARSARRTPAARRRRAPRWRRACARRASRRRDSSLADCSATMRGRVDAEPSSIRRTSPPVACDSGFSFSVVEVTSENSFGLTGPTLISAFSAPSLACHSPSSSAVCRPRHRPGSPAAQRQLAGLAGRRGDRHRRYAVGHRLTHHRRGSPAPAPARRSASSSSSGSFISQCDMRRKRSGCGPPPS